MKIKVEIEVPDGEYCDCNKVDPVCPVCMEGYWNKCYCAIFNEDLEIDYDSGYCIRCDKCKQAEVEDE